MKILTQSLIASLMIALLAVSADGAQFTNFVTLAGTAGSAGSADGTNGTARFHWPYGVAQDTRSNLYVVDGFENIIRKLTPDGTNWIVTTIAGTPGGASVDADGTNGAASFDNPVGITVDTNGNLYVGEFYGSTIRKITPVGTNWVVSTIAGQPRNYAWADGTNSAALFYGPQNLTLDSQGNLYVADSYNSVIRKMTPVGTNWVVTTIAGQPGNPGYADGTNGTASFFIPYGLACDSAGNLYMSDNVLGFGGATIRRLTAVGTNWVVTTIAGSPTVSGATDGTNSDALFNSPLSIAADSAGNLFVADAGNGLIRKLTPAGTNWVASTISAPGRFSEPWGATLDSAGNLFVTDYLNSTVLAGVVQLPPPPAVAFSGTPASGVVPLTVTFVNLTSNATNYVWDFGDGHTLSTSSNTNVAETYTNTGSYTVILTAQGPGGASALTNTAYIVVTSQTTTVPNPTIVYNFAAHTVVVSWPATGNYVLQTNSDLTLPWVNYGGPVATGNGTNSVTLPLPATGYMYFRLASTGQIVTVPNLAIGIAANAVLVSWPATGSFTLQTNADLTASNWVNYGGTINTGGGTNSAAFPPGPGNLFFRLKQ
jgi:PKD repeat protein